MKIKTVFGHLYKGKLIDEESNQEYKVDYSPFDPYHHKGFFLIKEKIIGFWKIVRKITSKYIYD